MKPVRIAAACLLLAALAGCASSGNGQVRTLSEARAATLLVAGQTTREEVRQAFGEALVNSFPSGQEVWFYQYSDSPAQLVKYLPVVGKLSARGSTVKELRILFDKDGRVRKFRLQEIRLP